MTKHPAALMPPSGGPTPQWGITDASSHWVRVAERYAEALPTHPPARQWLLLAQLWHRASRPAAARAATDAARRRLAADGSRVELAVAIPRRIEWLLPAGDGFAVVRSIELLRSGDPEPRFAHRIELWSEEDVERPQWVEYRLGHWGDVTKRLYRAGLSSGDGQVDPTLVVNDSAFDHGIYARIADDPKFVEIVEGGQVRQRLEITGVDFQVGWAYSSTGRGCRVLTAEVQDVALAVGMSSNAHFVAALASDETIRLFDLSANVDYELSLDPRLADPRSPWLREPITLAFSAASDRLMAAFSNGYLVTWSTTDGTIVSELAPRCPGGVEEGCGIDVAVFSPDRRWLAIVDGDDLRVQMVRSGETRLWLADEGARYPQFVDNQRLRYVVDDAGEVRHWSPSRGVEVVAASSPAVLGGTPRMTAGRVDIPLEATSDERGDGAVARWNMATRQAKTIAQPWGDRTGSHHHQHRRVNVSERDGRLDIDTLDHEPLASVFGLPDGGWLAISASGAFDGTINAGDALVAVVRTPEEAFVAQPHGLLERQFVAGVVAAAFRGIDVPSP